MIEPQVKGDEWFMAKALEQAQLAFEAGEIPVGAVVVAKDKIIARSQLMPKCKPLHLQRTR